MAERVRRAAEREGVADAAELGRLLATDAEARNRFRRSVAMVVTGLFRDPDQFAALERDVLPDLLARQRRLRVWSAGCADGSELYSVGIVLARLGALENTALLGSDLLAENLEIAAEGVYGDVRLPGSLRARMRWEQRDLLREPAPNGNWGLVLCRNLAIYLRPEAKQRLHTLLAGALSSGGVLVLGRAERLADPAALGLELIGPHAYMRQA